MTGRLAWALGMASLVSLGMGGYALWVAQGARARAGDAELTALEARSHLATLRAELEARSEQHEPVALIALDRIAAIERVLGASRDAGSEVELLRAKVADIEQQQRLHCLSNNDC